MSSVSAFSFNDLFRNPFSQPKQVSTCGGSGVGMANPAAVYCKELGYDYKIVTEEDAGQNGVCIFNKRNQCEEWEFLQGKCGQKYNYCSKKGHKTKVKTDGKNEFTQEYVVCTTKRGKEIGSVTKLMDLSEKSTKGFEEEIDLKTTEIIKIDYNKKIRTNPESFDWRNHNGENWITSIKNQGTCGSCWAFSSVGVVESAHNIYSGNSNLDLDLSEEYLVSDCYDNYDQDCCGGYHWGTLEDIGNNGVPDEGCMGYISGSGCHDDGSGCAHYPPDCSNALCDDDLCEDWNSRLVDFDEYEYYAPGSIYQEELKGKIIEKGPVSASMGIGSYYGGWFDGEIYRCSNPTGTNHAVNIIGYNNQGNYWIAKNQWGTSFGEEGYFKIGYGECKIDTSRIAVASLIDTDNDSIGDLYDNCDYTPNPAQGDIDNDTIGDACDADDLDFERYFFGNYTDTEGINFDQFMGGGPCNKIDGCEYSDEATDIAYCNHEDWPNICVYEGSCYLGDGSVILDIDGPEGEKHEAMCVGLGWWDLDSGGGTDPESTPLPGIEICEMGGYTWTNQVVGERVDVGEFELQLTYNGFGCCGDDEDEYEQDGVCYESEEAARAKTLKKPILKSIPPYAFGLGLFLNFFKKKPL